MTTAQDVPAAPEGPADAEPMRNAAPTEVAPTESAPDRSRKRRKGKWTAVAVAAVVLFVGGGAVGYSLPDPTTSAAYASVAQQKSAAEADRDSARSDYGNIKTKYDTLLNGITGRENTVAKREAAVSTAESTLKDAQAAVKKREDAVTGAETTKAANTIGDGTWTVGKDIEAGTYRAAADVGSSCYWGIYATGSNGSNIIENDIPGGGRPTVSVQGGQDFKSSRCGKWEKQ